MTYATQCDPTATLKYNSGTDKCEAITSCDKNTLNAKYCSGEATPAVCKDTYHWGIFYY